MTDWTTLPNAAVGVGGLPSGTTVTALRDNPIAISEGAPGAPKVTSEGLDMLVGGGPQSEVFTDLHRIDKVLISIFGGIDLENISSNFLGSYTLSSDNGATFPVGNRVTLVQLTSNTNLSYKNESAVVELGSSFNAIAINLSGSGGGEGSFSILGVAGVKP